MDRWNNMDDLEKSVDAQLQSQTSAKPGKTHKSGLTSRAVMLSVVVAGAIISALHKSSRMVGEEAYLGIMAIAFGSGVLLVAMGSFNLLVKDSKARISSICWGLFLVVIGIVVAMYYLMGINDLRTIAVAAAGFVIILGLWAYLVVKKPFKD